MARGYTVPWKIGQQGFSATVAKYGFVDLNVPGSNHLPTIRVTFLGQWDKPQTQSIRYSALNPRETHFVWKATWSNPGNSNEHLIEGFKVALGNITKGLGTRADDYVSRRTAERMQIPLSYADARRTLMVGQPDDFRAQNP